VSRNIPLAPFKGGIMGEAPSKGESWEKLLQRGNHGRSPFKGGI